MNSKLPSSSYSVLQESSSDAALSMSALGKPGWTHSSLTSLEAAAKASKTQLGTFRACSFILLTSSNYLHFHINFFPPCLFYVPFPTTQLPALAPWQWKREKKKCNHLTGYSPAEPQPQAGGLMRYCCLQIHNSKKLQWWWAAQVQHLHLASTERKNNETFVPSSDSKAKTTAQRPLVFWMEANKMIFLLHFRQWVHKMFVRIILSF